MQNLTTEQPSKQRNPHRYTSYPTLKSAKHCSKTTELQSVTKLLSKRLGVYPKKFITEKTKFKDSMHLSHVIFL
jgi:hypothetical protein